MGHVDSSQVSPLYANTTPGLTADANVFDPAIAALIVAINENFDDFEAFKASVTLPIPDQSIVTNHLRNLAVTNPKLAPLAVTADKIADGTITTAKLADLVITAQKIANGTITEPKYATGSVSKRAIAPNAVDATKMDPSLFANITDISINARFGQLDARLADIAKTLMKPFYIEYFASFSKYGLGTPSGIANYTGGNYVLTVSGNAGESFVTVTAGNIADAGLAAKWPCVIQNNNGIFDANKVLGTDGINRVNLLSPLRKNISGGLLGNLHDAVLGQHYTQLGYYAFAQHIYFANPRYAERNSVLAQFLEDDTSGKWTLVGVGQYAISASMVTPDDTYKAIGGKALNLYATDNAKYAEWQENLNGYKGYLECFVGCDVGSIRVDFYLDGAIVETKTVNREVERLTLPFEYANTGKIRISALGGFPQNIRIGRTTWFVNEKYSKSKLIQPSSKLAYIGDSWGVFHNKATTRELLRLMTADGGSPTVQDYSKSGATSTYAKAWFDTYIIANKPDVVIIEYFTNDFNSINGADVGTFTNPEGVQQDMNITSLTQYISNIQYMIDRAIEFGIQPIVIMPSSTNSVSQVLTSANNTNDIWNGLKISTDTPYFQSVTAGKVISNVIEPNGTVDMVIKGRSINSSVRKGVVIDSDTNLTGGRIVDFSNNGVSKAGIRHDGAAELTAVKAFPQSGSFANNANNRGCIYLLNSSLTSNVDELRVVIQLADGSYVQKKIQLVD
jgi:hypothetical protein